MSELEKLERLSNGFMQLSDEGREYILAISRALIFAQQNVKKLPSEPKRKANSSDVNTT